MVNLQQFFAANLSNAGFVKIDNFSESLALSVLADIPAIYHGKEDMVRLNKYYVQLNQLNHALSLC